MEIPAPSTFRHCAAIEEIHPRWWEARWFAILAIVLAAVPLIGPEIPPLVDVPGHMGRWYIALTLSHSPTLQAFYDFRWAPVGNLGADLLVVPLARVIGLEPASKLVVMAIPMLTVAGMLAVAREAHGRLPPTAIIALPLAYAVPFQMGFVNFQLAQALAYLSFALWLRLGRLNQLALRAAIMIPLSFILWLAHDFGWGMFGLMAFGGELARLRKDMLARKAIARAVIQCLPLALPAVAMALSHRSTQGVLSDDWFNLPLKAGWILSILRDRGTTYDTLCLIPAIIPIYMAGRDRTIGFSALLATPALFCLLAFLVLPRLLLSGAYVDLRMAPAMLTLALLAVRPPADRRTATVLALAGAVFLGMRTVGTTTSFLQRSAVQHEELTAIDALPRGAAVLTLVAARCEIPGADDRLNHIAGLAIVRRDAFVNEQWALSGQQLLTIRRAAAKPFLSDPSQNIYPESCKEHGMSLPGAVASFSRKAFDHVWTIGFPPGAAQAADLQLIWAGRHSALYRVVP